MRYTGDPVAGDAGVPAMRVLNRKRVVATAFVAAHLVAVSFESTGEQDSESANCVTTCQALYSGSVAPDMRIMSPATTPVAVPVPVVPTIESGFVGDLLVNTETDPLCTVTVSLLRDTRRATSARLVSVLFAEGRPPCGAALPTTERATITAVSTVPAAELPATGDAPGRPGGTSANRNAGPVVPVAVSAKRYRPVSRTAYCDAPR